MRKPTLDPADDLLASLAASAIRARDPDAATRILQAMSLPGRKALAEMVTTELQRRDALH